MATLIPNLRFKLMLSHDLSDTIYATLLTGFTQVCMYPRATIRAATGHIKRFNEFQQAIIFKRSIAYRLFQPRIKTTAMQLKKTAHPRNGKLILMITNEAVLYSGLLAKYLAAFFKISRSSVTRFNCASNLAIFNFSSDD